VAAALGGHAVVLPHHRSKRGHPVGFAASCRDALLMLKGPQGAALVVRAQALVNPVAQLELDDPGVVTDIDTAADLANAELLLAAR